MFKNVQEAKFSKTSCRPSLAGCSPPSDQMVLNFDSFFTHILAHEMTHGIGPHKSGVAASRPRN